MTKGNGNGNGKRNRFKDTRWERENAIGNWKSDDDQGDQQKSLEMALPSALGEFVSEKTL